MSWRENRQGSMEHLKQWHIQQIVDASGHQPRMVDLATGNNDFNVPLLRALREEDIIPEIILTDNYPRYVRAGLSAITSEYPYAPVYVALTDLGTHPLRDMFPVTEVANNAGQLVQRLRSVKVALADETVDVVIGDLAFGHIDNQTGLTENIYAMLKPGGRAILFEWEVVEAKSPRSEQALKGMTQKTIDRVTSALERRLGYVTGASTRYTYQNPDSDFDECVQPGDSMLAAVLVYEKRS